MADTGVRVEGLREVVRNLERLGVEAEDLKAAFSAIAGQVVTEASGMVPVLTGALKNTIRPARTKNKAVVRAGTARVPYAGVINYGRAGAGGTGFLTTPANRDPEGKARQIEAALDDLIRRYDLKR